MMDDKRVVALLSRAFAPLFQCDVLTMTDAAGTLLMVSPSSEQVFGFKADELIGKNVHELEKKGVVTPSSTRLALQQRAPVVLSQQTRTGRKLWVRSIPVHDDTGAPLGVLNVSYDVTDEETMELVAESPAMQRLLQQVAKVANADVPVLLTGESGVGKERIAECLHRWSHRRAGPFVRVNCAAIPESLAESEWFGYESGAFTGALRSGKKGWFEQAHGGTLFLDEVGELPMTVQAKLLRVLQDKTVIRLGGNRPIRVDVRIVAATNRDLLSMVEQGQFRRDLFHRLEGITLEIPPLRERREDIRPLVERALRRANRRYGRSCRFAPEALVCLERYEWPGNVRQLENTVERLVLLSEQDVIDVHDLPPAMRRARPSTTPVTLYEILPLRQAVAEVERQLLAMAKERYVTLSAIARALGVNPSTVCRKLRKYGL